MKKIEEHSNLEALDLVQEKLSGFPDVEVQDLLSLLRIRITTQEQLSPFAGVSEEVISKLKDEGCVSSDRLDDIILSALAVIEDFAEISKFYRDNNAVTSVTTVMEKVLESATKDISEPLNFVAAQGWDIKLLRAKKQNSQLIKPGRYLKVEVRKSEVGHVE